MGQKVVVVDTPGLFRYKENQEEVMKEIKESVSKVQPHVFLILLKAGEKFTEELQKMVENFCDTFGRNTMAHTLVLFTRGDELKSQIEEFICSNTNLHDLIIKCHWRYHVFNNRDESPDQVTALLHKINCMIQATGGRVYTAEMLQQAEEALKEKQQQQQQQQEQQQQQQQQQKPELTL